MSKIRSYRKKGNASMRKKGLLSGYKSTFSKRKGRYIQTKK